MPGLRRGKGEKNMDTHEIIALLIVVIAALLLIRHYRKSNGNCCKTGCFGKMREEGKEK